MSSLPQQIGFRYGGRQFPVYIGSDNRFYAYDPELRLPGAHGNLPGADYSTLLDADAQHQGLNGLDANPVASIAQSVVPAALSFVPVVGPILGPIASVIGSVVGNMFGGNDPTPISTLDNNVLQLRTQIAQARTALGQPDSVPQVTKTYAHMYHSLGVLLELWPNNTSINDPNHWICDFQGVNCPSCGNIRKCFYAAINKLQPIAQSLAAQAHDAQLTQNIIRQINPAGTGIMSPIPGTGVAPNATPSSIITGGGGISPSGQSFVPTDIAQGTPAQPLDQSSLLSTSTMGTILTYLPIALLVYAIAADSGAGKKTRTVRVRRRHVHRSRRK